MNHRKASMTPRDMEFATVLASESCASTIANAHRIQTDSERERREGLQLCKACFYARRVSGQAITSRPCMSCGESQQYPNTDSHKLCTPCAKAGHLCKRCGGDINMNPHRKTWPAPIEGDT